MMSTSGSPSSTPTPRSRQGFTAGLMPTTLGVKEEEIPHIIEYIKSLK